MAIATIMAVIHGLQGTNCKNATDCTTSIQNTIASARAAFITRYNIQNITTTFLHSKSTLSHPSVLSKKYKQQFDYTIYRQAPCFNIAPTHWFCLAT